MIALVGADGAGKSTAVEALAQWLGRTFAVTRGHLGRPPASLMTRALRTVARGRSAIRRLAGRGRTPQQSIDQVVLAAALARDRRREFERLRRRADAGELVVCDRFPLPELKSMDAPRVQRFADPHRWRRLTARLAAYEQRCYDAISAPDVLVVLRVDPEIAVGRKPEENPDFVRARWEEIWAIAWDDVPGAHVVDASAPATDVFAALRALVWAEV